MGRRPCCDKTAVKRGTWSPEEDAALKHYVQTHGSGGNWITLPHKAGLRRCGKSCRLRWLNYLRPNIKHGGFTEEEDSIICNLYNQIGSRWSVIASQLPGRTDNDVKNYWNTKLKKRMIPAGKIANNNNNNNNYPSSRVDPLSDFASYYVPRFEFSNHFEQCYNYLLAKQPRIDICSDVDVTPIGFHDANANIGGEEGSLSVSDSNSVLLEYKQPLIPENPAEANFQGYDQMIWVDMESVSGSGSGFGFSGHEEYLLGEAAGFQSHDFSSGAIMQPYEGLM